MDEKNAYIFDNETMAVTFCGAVQHGGFEAEQIGNAVFTDEPMIEWVKETYSVPDDYWPIWMREND